MQYNWVYEPKISNYEALLFYHALRRHRDSYYYFPIAVASREEVGVKYHFLCIAKPKSNQASSSQLVEIEVYKPAKSLPYATYIHRSGQDIF
jgi:hypothetical protein